MRLIGLFLLVLASIGCSTFKKAWDPYGAYGRKCGYNSPLKDVTLEQLNCMDKLGENDPDYRPDTKKRAELEAKAHAALEKALALLTFVKERAKDPTGGTLRTPRNTPAELIKIKLTRFCEGYQKPSYEVIESAQGQDYLGSKSGSNTYCNEFGCFGGANAVAVYDYFTDYAFECVGEGKVADSDRP